MRSRGRSNSNLGSSGNTDVAESGKSNESLRSPAVGMAESGPTQGKAATKVGLTWQIVSKRRRRFLDGETMEDKTRSRRSSCDSRVSKIVCRKVARKQGHSVRKLVAKLTRKGYLVSKTTVHQATGTTLGLKSFKRPLMPKI